MPFEGSQNLAWLFGKTLLAMVIVVALAIFVIRYLLPKLYGRSMGKNFPIRVVARVGLEPRKSLTVVRVGEKLLLLGVADHGISKIMDLDEKDWEGL